MNPLIPAAALRDSVLIIFRKVKAERLQDFDIRRICLHLDRAVKCETMTPKALERLTRLVMCPAFGVATDVFLLDHCYPSQRAGRLAPVPNSGRVLANYYKGSHSG
eukprot:scaffold3725_cov114-Cylindrotheca_fusiformis.AAC.8